MSIHRRVFSRQGSLTVHCNLRTRDQMVHCILFTIWRRRRSRSVKCCLVRWPGSATATSSISTGLSLSLSLFILSVSLFILQCPFHVTPFSFCRFFLISRHHCQPPPPSSILPFLHLSNHVASDLTLYWVLSFLLSSSLCLPLHFFFPFLPIFIFVPKQSRIVCQLQCV